MSRAPLLSRLLVLATLVLGLTAGEDGLSGTSAKIFVLLPDGSFQESSLMFSKYEMRAQGWVQTQGIIGGDYTSAGKKGDFTCTVKNPTQIIASVSWSGKVNMGDKKNGGASASGQIIITPTDPDKKPTTLKFVGDRPRQKH
jgi:hypothetical protein